MERFLSERRTTRRSNERLAVCSAERGNRRLEVVIPENKEAPPMCGVPSVCVCLRQNGGGGGGVGWDWSKRDMVLFDFFSYKNAF